MYCVCYDRNKLKCKCSNEAQCALVEMSPTFGVEEVDTSFKEIRYTVTCKAQQDLYENLLKLFYE